MGSHRLAYTGALIFTPNLGEIMGFLINVAVVFVYLAREDRPWLQEGVFVNSVPSTLALTSSVAGTAAALQAEKG